MDRNEGKNIIKPKIMITFREGRKDGGPYYSHTRIMNCSLKSKYDFIPIFLPLPKQMFSPRNFIMIVKMINKEKPDVIQFSGLQLEGFAFLFVSKLSKCKKTVCAIRGSSADAMHFQGIKKRIMLLLENWTLKHSTICFGVSRYVSEWHRVKKYSRNCFGFIYNLPDYQERKEKKQRIRTELGISDNEVVIVSTGRITVEKGYSVLLEVILKMLPLDHIHFVIVGDGPYLKTMVTEINSRGLDKKVHFTGFRDDVGDILDESNIFVICTYHETLCNSLIEASHHGLPAVASNVGGIPEIIKEGESGFLCQPGKSEEYYKAIMQLVDDEALRIEMGMNGKKRIDEIFSTDAITAKLDMLYSVVLQS